MSTNKERITRIAVGVDLSAESIHAAEQAMAIARQQGAEVVLVYVGAVPEAPEGLPPSMRATASHYRSMLNERLGDDRAALEALRQRLLGQGAQVSHVLVDGYPDTALAEAATSIGAGLVVVGTHGRTGVRRVLLGSVAERTVRLSDASVLVVRGPDVVNGGFKRIVVGSDFSPLADRAIARAVELAGKGARIEVVHAWTVPADVSPEGSMAAVLADLRGALSDDTLRAGAELCATWKARGADLTFRSVEGAPQVALTDVATELKADLVIVGSHGRRGLRRWLLGSVAEATVRHAPCDVLVAR
ncbi:MAG: universal stress protein [Deltaproteobacteria bacterium]|nr:universal stress protein [Deltaproteobacteria bacterium]